MTVDLCYDIYIEVCFNMQCYHQGASELESVIYIVALITVKIFMWLYLKCLIYLYSSGRSLASCFISFVFLFYYFILFFFPSLNLKIKYILERHMD